MTAQALVRDLIARVGIQNANASVESLRLQFANCELAAVAASWRFWAREKQLPPATSWRTWGFLTGRGFGKTKAISEYINGEVYAGRAMLILLMAQDEASAIAIQVQGPSGLIATAPPWFKPQWEATAQQLVWPNGARAYVRTPEVPGKIRGLEYHLAWLSEIQSWPAATRDEAFSNALLSTRLGYARIVWDATPKRRHPILRELVSTAEKNPKAHVIVRGTTHENASNLGEGYVEELERKYGGTSKGREELLGELLDEAENALVKQEWIDRARRNAPDGLKRRVIGIDPAITTRAGNDRTGIIEAGLGADGQVYLLGDHSDRHAPATWAELVLDMYVRGGCDCVVVETNKGGDLVTSNLRAHAGKKGLNVIALGKNETPRRVPGTVYVREVHARGSKEDRAQPLAVAYERGRVSHTIGVDLSDLEDTLTTWEPTVGQRSPDALDACVHAVSELLGLANNKPDPSQGFKGITELGKQLAAPSKHTSNLAKLLGGGGDGGGRI